MGARLLEADDVVPLNPGADGGGWVCISPPGSPRLGSVLQHENTAAEAMRKLEARQSEMITEELLDAAHTEAETEEAVENVAALFDGIDDVEGLERLGDVD